MDLVFCLQRSHLQDKSEDVHAEVASGELDLELCPRLAWYATDLCPIVQERVKEGKGKMDGKRGREREEGRVLGAGARLDLGVEKWKLMEAPCSLPGDGIEVWRRTMWSRLDCLSREWHLHVHMVPRASLRAWAPGLGWQSICLGSSWVQFVEASV